MTDTELSTLEQVAKAATPGPWDKESSYWNSSFSRCTEYPPFTVKAKGFDVAFCYGKHCTEDAAFVAAANPAAILELIAELRQARKERDWLAVQVVRYKTDCPMNREWEKCNDGQYENRDEPKNNQRCIKCWLEAAKEATNG